MHTIGKMGQLTARCLGNQLCRNMSRWLVQNPDCVIEAGSTAISYGMSGAPNVLSFSGAVGAGADAAFIAKECLDRNPSGRNGFLPGAHGSKDPPGGIRRPDGGWPTEELPDFLRGGKRDIRDTGVYQGLNSDGVGIYIGITNNVPRREAQHGARFQRLDPYPIPTLTRGEARAVEEALMTRCGKYPGIDPALQNINHAIDMKKYKNKGYDQALRWGMQFISIYMPGAC